MPTQTQTGSADTVAVLIAARKLIEHAWVPRAPETEDTHCLITAIITARCALGLRGCADHPVSKAMYAATGSRLLADFNDTHAHAEVLSAFDRAIAAEQAKTGAQS